MSGGAGGLSGVRQRLECSVDLGELLQTWPPVGRALEAAVEHRRRWVELLELWRSSWRDLVEQRSRERSDARRQMLVGAEEEGGRGRAQNAEYDPKCKNNQLGSKSGMQGS